MIKISDFIIILAVSAILNGIAFFLYLQDKNAARKNSWRTPENVLLCVALIGPFGSYAAMQIFHHKTRKWKFYLVPVFAILHAVLLRILVPL